MYEVEHWALFTWSIFVAKHRQFLVHFCCARFVKVCGAGRALVDSGSNRISYSLIDLCTFKRNTSERAKLDFVFKNVPLFTSSIWWFLLISLNLNTSNWINATRTLCIQSNTPFTWLTHNHILLIEDLLIAIDRSSVEICAFVSQTLTKMFVESVDPGAKCVLQSIMIFELTVLLLLLRLLRACVYFFSAVAHKYRNST